MNLIPIAIGPFSSAALFTMLRRKGISLVWLLPTSLAVYYAMSILYYIVIPPIVGIELELHLSMMAALTTILMAVMCFAIWFDEFIP